jgi:hypothetical protein
MQKTFFFGIQFANLFSEEPTCRCATRGNNEKRGARCPTSCQLVVDFGNGRSRKPTTSWQLVGHFLRSSIARQAFEFIKR